jgi:hypothetical protein
MKAKTFKEFLFPRVVSGDITQFCEVVKQQPVVSYFGIEYDFKPRYKVGEKVYLREPYCLDCDYSENEHSREWKANGKTRYKYAGDEISELAKDSYGFGKWNNNMSEQYARYFIEITDVKCERLQEISDEDCLKEGVLESDCNISRYEVQPKSKLVVAYAALINKINGKNTWKSNPYVWRYEFKLLE